MPSICRMGDCGRQCLRSLHHAVSLRMEPLASFFREHEEAQILLAGLVVILSAWWLIRALIAMAFNVILPLGIIYAVAKLLFDWEEVRSAPRVQHYMSAIKKFVSSHNNTIIHQPD